jgi:hypothetical protein
VTVTVTSAGGSTAIAGTTAFIADAAIQLVSVMAPRATAGTALSLPVVTFTTSDPNQLAEEFTADFDPGDGTSSPAIVVPGLVSGQFLVVANHSFAVPGSYSGRVTIRSTGGAGLSVAIASMVVGLTAAFPTVAATEDVPLHNAVIATIATDGGPPINPSLYTATIDWGDATAFTPGFIDPTTGGVRGSHVYQESGTYTVRITVGTLDNPGLAVFSRTIAVADVPIVLTGRLDPASDSGISNSDGITFVRQPTFLGMSEDLSRVTLSAQNVLGGPALSLGGTTADPSGFWQITSGVALSEGSYTITAMAVDRNGVTTASTLLGTITIDTVGPRVTNLGFAQFPGRLVVSFQDDRSGLAQAPLTDGRNYRVEKPHLRPGRLLVGDLSVTPPTGPIGPQTVTAPLTNKGRANLRGGTFTVTVFDSDLGITDVAGNALDGEFFGRFPSGNGVRGGDFVAIVDAVHNKVLSIGPSQQGTPIRNNPGAIPGVVLSPKEPAVGSAAPKKRQEAQKAKADAAKAAAAVRAAGRHEAAARARPIPQEKAVRKDETGQA